MPTLTKSKAKPAAKPASKAPVKGPARADAAKPSPKGKQAKAKETLHIPARKPKTLVKASKSKGRAAKPEKPIVRRDAPAPAKKGKGAKPKKGRHGEIVIQEAGHAQPGRMKIAAEKLDLQPAKSKARFKEENYEDFFVAEIMAELESTATIFNDRIARWRCQCCDTIIPVPRRTEVFHGDYHLVHDDIEGLLVNGEKFVPKAYTPIEVVQPGRLRNPWTGKTIEGKDLGTTGTNG